MFNIANNLTLARIAAVPIIVVLLYYPNKTTTFLALIFFIIASITDIFDGIIARRFNIVTNFGKFLDPLADKLLINSILIMLVWLGWVEAWIAVVIVGRETMVTGLRAIAADVGVVIAADKYGKMKTIMQMISLCPLILHYPLLGIDFVPLGTALLYIAVVLTIFSGINYLRRFFKDLHRAA
ncbi:CDP-diacylglycerol--glycerol-3-phosphate 3-phosphatidyltransferase [Desulfovibrio inopinatus]|uniref:CDP-diacylglycerol--glycerol-3-phosphate 3-phosphatidyltransferase n=1 Tax=Desulfovibrio inopinatus TaxID=102109 RepID=UPI00041138D8|nr:CDP-diacylglycerol--glycerol-3-phosphate 3-phosphatidyltransferase [Desulfovibrio inopinatus]